MPSLNVRVDDDRAMARLENVAPKARESLASSLRDLADEIAADARSRAQSHIRFLGVKAPGSYVQSIQGGVSEKDKQIVGYVRSGHPLAHLMELGFQISDWLIVPGTGKNTTSSAGAIMAFAGQGGTVFSHYVHRHATRVQPYPAMLPAFEAARGDIETALQSALNQAASE